MADVARSRAIAPPIHDLQPRTGRRMAKTPASLLERLKRPGDQDAWERFVKLYAPMILQWARQAGLEENAAADLVQDVFVILVQKMPEFSP